MMELNTNDIIVEVSTAPKLQQNIEQGFPNTTKRQHSTGEVNVQTVSIVPYVGTKFIHVKSTTTSNSHTYHQAIQFMNVQFESIDTQTNVTFKAADGQDYHVIPVDLNGHNVKVRCNCLDFYFRFANQNSGDKSLVGRAPRPYQRKTNDRPPANPDNVPGMCKHIIKVVEHLQTLKLVK